MFLILELSRLIIYSNPEATKCFFASDARYVKLHMSTKTDTERTHSMKKRVQEKYGNKVHDMHIDIGIYTITFADGISQCMLYSKSS